MSNDKNKNEVENKNETSATTLEDLPLMYKDMTNEKEEVYCVIGPDLGADGEQEHNGKYQVQFENKTTQEKKCVQLEDLDHVERFRNGLIVAGWRMYRPPGVSTNLEKSLKKSRKDKRYEEREALKKERAQKEKERRKNEAKEKLKKRIADLQKLKVNNK